MVPESNYGSPPANPPLVPFPMVSMSGGPNMSTLIDDTIRPDRQIYDARNGVRKATFDVQTKFRYGATDTFLEALTCGTWTQDVLKCGSTYRSFTAERIFADLTGKPYLWHYGTEANKLVLNMKADAMVDATWSFTSTNFQTGAAAMNGSTYAAQPTTKPFDSFTGSLLEGGNPIATLQDLTIEIDNGLEMRPVVGSYVSLRPSKLLLQVTGTSTMYFENATLLDKYINGTESSISVTLLDPAANSLVIAMPRVKYVGDGHPDVKGPGPVTLALKFHALLDDSSATTISFTRTAHA